MENNRIDAVLLERGLDYGYTKEDLLLLMGKMDEFGMGAEDEELLPVTIDGQHGTAFGFIRMDVAEEKLIFDLSQESFFAQDVVEVLDDMRLETESKTYVFAGIRTYLFR